MPIDRIPHAEYAARRVRALTALKGAVGVLFAGDYDADSELPFRPHPHFEYLTGLVDEPDNPHLGMEGPTTRRPHRHGTAPAAGSLRTGGQGRHDGRILDGPGHGTSQGHRRYR